MAYDVTEERLKVRGSEQITRDLKVNRDAFINGDLDTKNIKIEDDLSVGGEAVFADDVAVHGDLYVTGTTTTTSEAQVSSSGNYIVTRDNNNSPMGIGQYSGLAVNNYATGKIATITSDHEGTWRISDSAISTAVTFTNISAYNGVYYSGISQTTTTGPTGILTDVDADELASVVLNGSSYYHHSGNDWFGPITLVNNALDSGSIVTDATLIATLDSLTKNDLVYYRSVISKSIDASTNQPLLTRSETSGLVNNDILVWDSSEEKAVDGGSKISDLVPKTTTVNGHALSSNITLTASDVGAATSTDITNAINTLDVTDSPVAGKYVSSVSETDGKITVVREDLGNLTVSGVKGNAEVNYRRGLVNLTPADIGAATSTDITNAINALDVASTGGDGKYISAISETDGKISATATTMDTAPTASSTKAVTSGGIKTAINTAETNAKNLANATGTLAIAHGGTGVTSQDKINCNIIADLEEGTSDVTDGTMFVSSYASDNGFADTDAVNKPYKRQFVHVWNYIKDKISSVLGLTATSYGGNAASASQADTVDGYHADTAANGSTVAARDVNGFLSAAIFHDSWATENINSYSSPTVMFKGNGEGYLRNTSLADLRTALGVPYAQVNSDWNATSGVAQILNKPSFDLDDTTGIKNFYVETDNQYAKCSVGRALSYISKRAPVIGNEDSWAEFINKVFGGFNTDENATIYNPIVTGTLLIPGESTARNLRNSKLQFTKSSQSGHYIWTLYIDNVTVWSEESINVASSKWTYDLYISGGAQDIYYKRRFNVTATIDHFEDENGNTINPASVRKYRNEEAAFNVIYNLSSSIPQDMNTTNMSIGILIPNSVVALNYTYVYDLRNNRFRDIYTGSTSNWENVIPRIDAYYNATPLIDSNTPNAFNIIAPFVLLSNNSAKVSVKVNGYNSEYNLNQITDILGSETLTVTEYYS